MDNKIIISRYSEEDGLIYFKYNGEVRMNIPVYVHWNGLTLHYSEMNLSDDSDVTYFIGFNRNKIKELNKIEVKFSFQDTEENHIVKINDGEISQYENYKFSTNPKDPSFYTFNEVLLNRIYENKLVRIYENDIVVDIGSNYGFFSLYAQEFKPSKVYCIEPSKKIFNHLNNNTQGCIYHQIGVSGFSQKQNFLESYDLSSSGRLDNHGDYEVEILGINDIMKYLGVEKIDFLKIDCEGSEREIFENITKQTIDKINKIVVEYHSEEIKKIILDKLTEFDFVVEKITPELIFTYKKDYYKKKKKIALVSTYCDTEEKKQVFLNLIKKVKSCGVDVMAISPLPLGDEYIKACDYLYFTKENPILTWPVRLFTFWKEFRLPDGRISTMQRGVGDYSWAALYHVKKMTQIAMDYDYEIFYHMIYDLEIDDVVERALKDFEGNIVYPRRDPHHPDTLWETTLHFMSFDRDLMKKIEKEITLEEYLSTNGVAEGEVLKWKNKFNIQGSEHPVKDLIFYWKNYDFFDYSPVKDFKMFISKNQDMDIWLGESPVYQSILPSKLRIIFYDFQDKIELEILLNGKKYSMNPIPFEYIEFDLSSQEVENFKIKYHENLYDLTEQFNEIVMNQIYYNHRP